MLSQIYRIIWLFLFLLYSLFENINNCYLRFQSLILWSYDLCRGSVIESTKLIIESEKSFLNECKKDLRKLPKHLSIVVGPENNQVNELLLRKLFTYANIVDVDCISYFDTRLPDKGLIKLNNLKETKDAKLQVLKENYYQWSYSSVNIAKQDYERNGLCLKNGIHGNLSNGCAKLTNGTLKNNNENCKSTSSNGCCNGLPNKTLKVYQIKSEDGRPMMASLCRELFKKRSEPFVAELLEERQHLSDYITKNLSSRLMDIGDPDLCIIFNQHTCTFGLLPWQTRFTEIYTHSSTSDFTVYSFVKILYQFAKCEQRWGK